MKSLKGNHRRTKAIGVLFLWGQAIISLSLISVGEMALKKFTDKQRSSFSVISNAE